MKLWHVAQWGNKEEGADGYDTQCIIRSNDMLDAVAKAQLHLSIFDWKDGKPDVVYLLGEDEYVGQDTTIIIQPWTNPALNLAHHLAWYRNEFDCWVNEKDMYGDSHEG